MRVIGGTDEPVISWKHLFTLNKEDAVEDGQHTFDSDTKLGSNVAVVVYIYKQKQTYTYIHTHIYIQLNTYM